MSKLWKVKFYPKSFQTLMWLNPQLTNLWIEFGKNSRSLILQGIENGKFVPVGKLLLITS